MAWLIRRAATQYRAYGELSPLPPASAAPTVTVIVPARDEAGVIERCLDGLRRQDYPSNRFSIVVVDDGSRDGTGGRARRAAGDDPRIRVIAAGALPPGWAGKPHACWRGASEARGAWLCFIDADTVPRPALLRSAVAAAERDGIDFLSLEPRQELLTAWERLILPAGLCALGFVGDLRETGDARHGRAAANGQFILVRRAIYDRVGGHAAVCDAVAEDSALAMAVKAAGGHLALRAAPTLISVRMYRSLPQLWEGLAKNVTETFGGAGRTALLAVLGPLLAWAAIAVPAFLAWGLPSSPPALAIAALVLASLASLALVGLHVAATRYFAIPLWYGLLFPLGYTLAGLLAVDGLAARRRGHIAWKGRVYPVPPRRAPHSRR